MQELWKIWQNDGSGGKQQITTHLKTGVGEFREFRRIGGEEMDDQKILSYSDLVTAA